MEKAVKKSNKKQDLRATGKRKSAIARVILKPGSGKVTVNNKTLKDYFGNRLLLENKIKRPFETVGIKDSYDITANIVGGGKVGQADALMYSIAKVLATLSAANKKSLKEVDLLTRDAKIKESKKYGRKKARKKFQFSKR